ncbi:Flagellar assembly protein FliH [Marinobacterium lacunae]|uniref:Flagellar assembly protein FliH n=1 Tax=Marinobacterium lacunae TaxID=1232683 RepID=A0A081G0J6_9GAMM|nr:flagellar assembly protein FliH [Marinobacterium lacunae]KEA64301.1 Flagellar assembly protein FliH [Marinobacterium lacunae]
MKSEIRKPIRIRASEVRDASSWRLPDMSESEHERLIALAQKRKPEPQPEVQVVEEEVYAEKLTLSQWEEICEAARAEGLEQGRSEGLAAGREEGFQQGLNQGLEEGRARIDEQVARLAAVVDQLQRPLEQQRSELESLLVTLVRQLSEAVVRAELRTRPDLLLETINEALSCIPPHAGAPVLSLHPDDCHLIEHDAQQRGWELVADESVSPGGCVLQAGACRVDSSVETRFEQVAMQLLEHLLPGATTSSGQGGEA